MSNIDTDNIDEDGLIIDENDEFYPGDPDTLDVDNSIEKTNRKDMYVTLLPSTQRFVRAIYGSFKEYMKASNPDKDPNRMLFDICMLHSKSFTSSLSAIRALQILGIPIEQPKKVCRVGGCSPMTEDPVAKLHIELTRICNSKERIASYREDL